MALTYDQITAITRKYWMKDMPQLVFDQDLVTQRLWQKGTKPRSGESIQQSVMYQASKGGAYSPYDTFDISAEDQITAANYSWKYYEVPVTLSRDDILKNAGPEGVFNLLNSKMELARMKMHDLIASDMFAIGVTDFSEVINSLDYICDDGSATLGTSATLGGISKTSYSWWAGNLTPGTGGGLTWADLNPAFFAAVDGSIRPDLCVMHNTAFSTFMIDQQGQQQYVKQSDLDAGFLTAMVNGVTVVADLHCSSSATQANNRVYFLNTKFLDLISHRDENMRLEPFAKPVDQAVMVAHVMWAGELITNDPSRQSVFYDFDDTSN